MTDPTAQADAAARTNDAAPFVRPLKLGDTGPDVLAVKRALKKAGHGAGVAPTYRMGATAVRDLKSFQRMCKLNDDGVYGPDTHHFLAPYFDADGIRLLEEEQAKLNGHTKRDLFLRIADLTVVHVSLFAYTEDIGEQPGERDWFRVAPIDQTGDNWAQVVAQHGKLSTDCSAHFIGCGEHAGIPSSVAHGVMDSDGATGALLADLTRITAAQAQPGDAVIFVGPSNPAGVHIFILRRKLANGDWEGINMGGPGQPANRLLSDEASWHAQHAGAPTSVYLQLPV